MHQPTDSAPARPLAGQRFAEFHADRARRQARHRLAAHAGVALAAVAVPLVLWLQLTVGWLTWLPAARQLGGTLPWVAAAIASTLLLAPEPALTTAERALSATSRALVGVVSVVVLTALFVLSAPAAAVFGRRSFRAQHPASAPWSPGSQQPWQQATWAPKTSAQLAAADLRRSTPMRALLVFARQRNFFLLTMAVALVILGSVSVFAQSSTVAPFMYTVF